MPQRGWPHGLRERSVEDAAGAGAQLLLGRVGEQMGLMDVSEENHICSVIL